MRKFLIFILIISFVALLMPISVFASSQTTLSCNFYTPNSINTPYFIKTCQPYINHSSGATYSLKIFKIIAQSNSTSTRLMIQVIQTIGDTQNIIFSITQSFANNGELNYFFFNNNSYSLSASGTIIPFPYNSEVINIYFNTVNEDISPLPPGTPESTIINVTYPNGTTIDTCVINHEDIIFTLGTDQWIGRYFSFNRDSGFLDLIITDINDNVLITIPTNILISTEFILVLTDSGGVSIDFVPGSLIDLSLFDLEVTPYTESGFIFTVSDKYANIRSIDINLYDGQGINLLDSTSVMGTYIDYSIKVDYYEDGYGGVIAEMVLYIFGITDVVDYTLSFNLTENGFDDFVGLSLQANKTYVDIPYNNELGTVLYTGTFLPDTPTHSLNFYLYDSDILDSIRNNISKDYIDDAHNISNKFEDVHSNVNSSKEQLANKGGYEIGGIAGVIEDYFNVHGANNINEVLGVLYSYDFVITMIIIVFSIAACAYVLYGKRS